MTVLRLPWRDVAVAFTKGEHSDSFSESLRAELLDEGSFELTDDLPVLAKGCSIESVGPIVFDWMDDPELLDGSKSMASSYQFEFRSTATFQLRLRAQDIQFFGEEVDFVIEAQPTISVHVWFDLNDGLISNWMHEIQELDQDDYPTISDPPKSRTKRTYRTTKRI